MHAKFLVNLKKSQEVKWTKKSAIASKNKSPCKHKKHAVKTENKDKYKQKKSLQWKNEKINEMQMQWEKCIALISSELSLHFAKVQTL